MTEDKVSMLIVTHDRLDGCRILRSFNDQQSQEGSLVSLTNGSHTCIGTLSFARVRTRKVALSDLVVGPHLYFADPRRDLLLCQSFLFKEKTEEVQKTIIRDWGKKEAARRSGREWHVWRAEEEEA